MSESLVKGYMEYTAEKPIHHKFELTFRFDFPVREYVDSRNGGQIKKISTINRRPSGYEDGYFVFYEYKYANLLFEAGFVPSHIYPYASDAPEDTIYVYKMTYKEYMAHSNSACVKLIHVYNNIQEITSLDEKSLNEYINKEFKDIKNDNKNYYTWEEELFFVIGNPKKYMGKENGINEISRIFGIKDGVVDFYFYDKQLKVPEFKRIFASEKPYRKDTERSTTYYSYRLEIEKVKAYGLMDKIYNVEFENIGNKNIITKIKKVNIKNA